MQHVDPSTLEVVDDGTSAFVRDFLEWARGKDPEETYCYISNENCALARYLRERHHYRHITVTSRLYQLSRKGGWHTIPPVLVDPLRAGRTGHISTFGALVRRLERALGVPA